MTAFAPARENSPFVPRRAFTPTPVLDRQRQGFHELLVARRRLYQSVYYLDRGNFWAARDLVTQAGQELRSINPSMRGIDFTRVHTLLYDLDKTKFLAAANLDIQKDHVLALAAQIEAAYRVL